MKLDVRSCADRAEFDIAVNQIGQYFGSEPGAEWISSFTNVLPLDRMLAAWDGDSIVGGAASLPIRLSVPGGSLACSGTTLVGVAPTHRRRGVLTAMMRADLERAHERGDPLAALWASDEGIYGRFGYGRAAFTGEIAVPRMYAEFDAPLEPRGRLRLVESAEAAEAFPPLWEAFAQLRPGTILRSAQWWRDRTLADPPDRRFGGGPKRFALLEDGGEPAGYAIYRHRVGFEAGSSASKLEVVEAVGADARATAAVWRFLLDVDWTAEITASLVPPDHPLFFLLRAPRRMRYRMGDGLWVRLVDVGAALAGRTYADGAELVLDVRDALCPWNGRRWRLADGAAEPTDSPADLALDISALGAAYLGGMALTALAQSGRVEELTPGAISRGDRSFRHDLHPWCPEIF